ncbi:MAG: methyltransferase [Acidobacteriia bacterium]|nr:methyltransferase [Terriglobia bacterium]
MSQPAQSPPPHGALVQMLLGKWVSSAISAAAHFGIADHLESGPKSPKELASLTGTQERPLYRLLRANASVGVFTELEDGRFAQTPLSEPLRTNAKPCVRHMAMMLTDDWHIRFWEQLPWCVETGKPASYKLNGMPMFDWMAQHPEKTGNFNQAMTDLSSGDAAAVVQSYDFSRFEHIVDVAGGHGTLLAAILDQAPKLRGTLAEMPHVIEGARKAGILDRLANRSTLEAVNILESVPAGADAYIMKFIIHDWYDPECIKILSNCRKGIRPGGRLLVVDQVVPAGNEPAMSKIVDLEMLVLPGGMERTERQFRELFAASGFRLERIIPMPAPQCIIEGVPV